MKLYMLRTLRKARDFRVIETSPSREAVKVLSGGKIYIRIKTPIHYFSDLCWMEK